MRPVAFHRGPDEPKITRLVHPDTRRSRPRPLGMAARDAAAGTAAMGGLGLVVLRHHDRDGPRPSTRRPGRRARWKTHPGPRARPLGPRRGREHARRRRPGARRPAPPRGRRLESATLGWNLVGIAVLAFAAVAASSVALAGFGLDSLIEIGASTVVLWELSGTGKDSASRPTAHRDRVRFLVVYLAAQSTLVLVVGFHPRHSPAGIVWTAMTAAVMFLLAAAKARTGAALRNRVLLTEGKVTLVDGILATAVLVALVLNASLRWWWADPAAGYVLVYYGAREARAALKTR